MAETENSTAAGRVAFQYPSFVLFQTARFCIVLANEMQSVAVGWQVYEITKRPLDLGLVGLAQFLPGILLFLIAGHMADHSRWTSAAWQASRSQPLKGLSLSALPRLPGRHSGRRAHPSTRPSQNQVFCLNLRGARLLAKSGSPSIAL